MHGLVVPREGEHDAAGALETRQTPPVGEALWRAGKGCSVRQHIRQGARLQGGLQGAQCAGRA
eukprot:13519070-Alexandrium_andersonii.AAC.1